MSDTMLKSNWERHYETVTLDLNTAQQLVNGFTKDSIESLTLLSNGCANSNYLIQLENGQKVALRIYMRDASALAREVGVNKIVSTVLPVADFLHADDTCTIYPHSYAIMEYKEGILMRDLIFSKDEAAIQSVVTEAGEYLSILRKMQLPMGGFFHAGMNIMPFEPDKSYFDFMMDFLQDTVVAKSLGSNSQKLVEQTIASCVSFIPEINDANLTHGDYDPANMLVTEANGTWKISAILDWEFAHAGTYLLDMGLMLRYSHQLPDYFEECFMLGIESMGPPLPSDWKIQAKLMDLMCLMQRLHASPAEIHPYVNRDVVRLINHTVQTLPQLKKA